MKKLILISTLLLPLSILSQQKEFTLCEDVNKNFTGECKSYFKDGTLGVHFKIEEGEIIKVKKYFSNGVLSFNMDKSKEKEFTSFKYRYYPNGNTKYSLEIENGTGEVKGFDKNGSSTYYGVVKNNRLVFPWVVFDKNGNSVDTIQSLSYDKVFDDHKALFNSVDRGLFSLLLKDENTQLSVPSEIKEYPPLPIETEVPPSLPDLDEDTVDSNTEKFPSTYAEFPGGANGLKQYISINLKYPEEAKKYKFEGRVFVEFIVNKDGSVSDPIVLRQFPTEIEQEVKRLILSMPKWKPEQKNGKAVSSRVRLPIHFLLP